MLTGYETMSKTISLIRCERQHAVKPLCWLRVLDWQIS
jgi:hypothetical protein